MQPTNSFRTSRLMAIVLAAGLALPAFAQDKPAPAPAAPAASAPAASAPRRSVSARRRRQAGRGCAWEGKKKKKKAAAGRGSPRSLERAMPCAHGLRAASRSVLRPWVEPTCSARDRLFPPARVRPPALATVSPPRRACEQQGQARFAARVICYRRGSTRPGADAATRRTSSGRSRPACPCRRWRADACASRRGQRMARPLALHRREDAVLYVNDQKMRWFDFSAGRTATSSTS